MPVCFRYCKYTYIHAWFQVRRSHGTHTKRGFKVFDIWFCRQQLFDMAIPGFVNSFVSIVVFLLDSEFIFLFQIFSLFLQWILPGLWHFCVFFFSPTSIFFFFWWEDALHIRYWVNYSELSNELFLLSNLNLDTESIRNEWSLVLSCQKPVHTLIISITLEPHSENNRINVKWICMTGSIRR